MAVFVCLEIFSSKPSYVKDADCENMLVDMNHAEASQCVAGLQGPTAMWLFVLSVSEKQGSFLTLQCT